MTVHYWSNLKVNSVGLGDFRGAHISKFLWVRKNSVKSKMLTHKVTSQVAKNMWMSNLHFSRMVHNMLKWLVIFILNKLAFYLYEGELCFKVINRKFKIATNENFGLWFGFHKQKNYGKVKEIVSWFCWYLEFLNWANLMKLWNILHSYKIFLLNDYIWPIIKLFWNFKNQYG